MKYCEYCGKAISDNAAFCSGCGKRCESIPAAPVPMFCENCGRPLVAGRRFCFSCGTPVSSAISIQTTPTQPVAHQRIAQPVIYQPTSEPVFPTDRNLTAQEKAESAPVHFSTKATTEQLPKPNGNVSVPAVSKKRKLLKWSLVTVAVIVVVCIVALFTLPLPTAPKSNIYYVHSVEKFSEGLAWVATSTKASNSTSNAQYACIDTSGNVQFMLEKGSSLPSPFANGVSCYTDPNGVYTVIGKDGAVIFSAANGLFDGIIKLSAGCHAAYTYTENFNEAGYKIFFINQRGEITSRISDLQKEIPELINCGEGVFAQKIRQNAAGEVTYRFYDAQSGNQYDIGEIGYHTNLSGIFNEGYAVIEGPRMGDIPRLVSTNGDITELNDFGYGNFYDFGPVSNGGVVCTSYYQDKVEGVCFYNIKTGRRTYLGSFSTRLDLNRAEYLRYDRGHLLMPLVGADGKKYYTIFDQSGNSIFDPISCQSVYNIGGYRIGVKYTSGTALLDGKGKVIAENIKDVTSLSFNDGWSVYDSRTNYISIQGELMFQDGILMTK